MTVLRKLVESSRWLFWLAAGLIFALDQVTKVLLWRPPGEMSRAIVVIPGLLRFIPHPGNRKGALGLGPQNPYFYVGVAVVGLAVVIYFLLTTPAGNGLVAAALGLLAGGALGNVLDRVAFGFVRDFIDLHFGEAFHWHTFNVADAAICVGFVLVVYDMLFPGRRSRAESDRSAPERKAAGTG